METLRKRKHKQLKRAIRIDLESLLELTRTRMPGTAFRIDFVWRDGSFGSGITRNPIEDVQWITQSANILRVKINSTTL